MSRFKEALTFAFLLVGLYGLAKHAAPFLPYGFEIGFLVTMLFQLYVPFWLIYKRREDPYDYGLNMFGIGRGWKKFDATNFFHDLKRVLVWSVITFIPWAFGFHFVQKFWAAQYEMTATFNFQLPPGFFESILANTILVALPEETFYRGFLLHRLLQKWPNKATFLTIPVGRAVLLSSLLFAAAHFIGEYSLLRLGPFFPALIFSLLTMRSGSIFGAVCFHSACNLFSEVLQASYRWH